MPLWWLGIRPATPEEDTTQETDAVIFTDTGEIPIQIKSSLNEKTDPSLPERTGKDIAIVYVDLSESDIHIREKVMHVIEKERQAILKKSPKVDQ